MYAQADAYCIVSNSSTNAQIPAYMGNGKNTHSSPWCFQSPVKRFLAQPCSTWGCKGGGSTWSACTCTRSCTPAQRISPLEEGSCLVKRIVADKYWEVIYLVSFLRQDAKVVRITCEAWSRRCWGGLLHVGMTQLFQWPQWPSGLSLQRCFVLWLPAPAWKSMVCSGLQQAVTASNRKLLNVQRARSNYATNLLFPLLLLPLFLLLLRVQAQYFPYSFSLQRLHVADGSWKLKHFKDWEAEQFLHQPRFL